MAREVNINDMENDVKKKKKKKGKKSPEETKDLVPYTKDSYVVLNIQGKHKLGFAFNKGQALLEEGVENQDDVESVKFSASDVVVSLGTKPPIGISVCGIKVEPYIKTQVHKKWGAVHFYRQLDPREEKTFRSVLKNVYSELKKDKLVGFLPLNALRLKHAKGKYAGSYTYKPRANTTYPDDILLKPEDMKDKKYLTYVMFHEAAHGVWFRLVPEDVKAKWIAAYGKRIAIQHIDKDKAEELLEGAVDYLSEEVNAKFKDFWNAELDEEDHEVMKDILKYILRVHKLKEMDLLVLLRKQGAEKLMNYWPKTTDIGTPVNDISEYAGKDVSEFFAECIAFHYTGKKLPKDIRKLIPYTIKHALKEY